MSVDVKICGIKTLPALNAAQEAGADYIGFVFFAPSPRNIAPADAAKLRAACKGRAKTVALFVDPADDLIEQVMAEVDPDFIQLHGHETPERVAQIKALASRPVIKALPVGGEADTAAAGPYEGIADIILFDAKPSGAKDALPGGNGVPFDWRAMRSISATKHYMLSGGLNPDNVAAAIEMTGARAVDVSSGVEISRGEKDTGLIRRFIENAHACT